MEVQWYPGHMTKAMRMMQEQIKLVDLIVELLDARAPLSSRNPDLQNLAKGKARVLILNKADMANEAVTMQWIAYFQKQGYFVTSMNAKRSGRQGVLQEVIDRACEKKRERDKKRGILNRPVRTMIVGIPNVGKSTLINTLAGKACAKTGNRPGVTKGRQWVRFNKQIELLDTPGVLWPKFEDPTVGIKLAMLGSIREEILPQEELACEVLRFLLSQDSEKLWNYYGINSLERPLECLREIAKRRGFLKTGGELDIKKSAHLLLDDFRDGRIGAVTLEMPIPLESQ